MACTASIPEVTCLQPNKSIAEMGFYPLALGLLVVTVWAILELTDTTLRLQMQICMYVGKAAGAYPKMVYCMSR